MARKLAKDMDDEDEQNEDTDGEDSDGDNKKPPNFAKNTKKSSTAPREKLDDDDGDGVAEENDGDEDEKGPGGVRKGHKATVPGEKIVDAADKNEKEVPRAKGKPWEKSEDLTGDDLEKSLSLLEQIVQDASPEDRKDALLNKALNDKLSKSEKTELLDLLGGETPERATLGEEIIKSMDDNNALQEALDVSGYLDAQHKEMCKSLDKLATHMEKSDNRQQEFNLVLAKALANVGTLVKSMSERVGVIESQPARGPKSRGAQPLSKSFGGQAPAENQMSKSVILDVLEEMLHKSSGGKAECGEDLFKASTKYESTNMISQNLLNEVQRYRAGAR